MNENVKKIVFPCKLFMQEFDSEHGHTLTFSHSVSLYLCSHIQARGMGSNVSSRLHSPKSKCSDVLFKHEIQV